MKKIAITIIAIVITSCLLFAGCGGKQVFDTTYRYDYAWISLPNGEVVEGNVESWRDYEDGDQIQVKINGVNYLTDTTRAVLAQGYSKNK